MTAEPLVVKLQEVIHSVRTGQTEVATDQLHTGEPNGRSRQCSPDAQKSRGNGRSSEASNAAAARAFNISLKTVGKWVGRFRNGGAEALRDRSSRPHSMPSQTPAATCDAVEALRRQRRTQAAISTELNLAPATVSRGAPRPQPALRARARSTAPAL